VEQRLAGGVNVVTRIGDTVRRPTGFWTPAVHALLRHLTAVGFAGAPAVHGIDGHGREVLDFIPGDVPDEPPPGDGALCSVARLLRAYHDATAGFVPPADAAWYLPAREPAEVICHGDAAPYNTVYRGGLPVAFIDFDTAHPGPRVWDAAYAAYRFVPLSTGGDPIRQADRLRLFLISYGSGLGTPTEVLAAAVARLTALLAHLRGQAAAGHPAFQRHLADGHDRIYEADIGHIRRHAGRLAGG
jgi:hypothetical protein